MDFDVAAIALATPPASAPVQSYRPAVAVKNLGIHDANVTGTLTIYDRAAGTLIVTMLLSANSIAPGETRNAVANQLWEPTPADIGRAFIFIATITYPPDQFLPNNNLQPATVIITAAPPTPPPPVEAHADQHEDGGGDQLTVEGLSGKLAEAQTPAEHASNHEDGGADQLDVAGLVGELATPQTPKIHATSHQVGGTDPVSGIEPGAHASSHEPGGDDEITGIDVTEHGSDKHDATVEATTNKDQNNGYAGLGSQGNIGQDTAAIDTRFSFGEHALTSRLLQPLDLEMLLSHTIPDPNFRRFCLDAEFTVEATFTNNQQVQLTAWIGIERNSIEVTTLPLVLAYSFNTLAPTTMTFRLPVHIHGDIAPVATTGDVQVKLYVRNDGDVPLLIEPADAYLGAAR